MQQRARRLRHKTLCVVLGSTATLAGLVLQAHAAHALDSVTWEQTNLVGLGYLPSSGIDGVDGPQTQAALKAFQHDQGLSEDGVYGAQSELALHHEVEAVQSKAGVTSDGYYGPATEAAVDTWQSAHRLGVDGIAGPDTMSAMGVYRSVYLAAQGMFGQYGWSVSSQYTCLLDLWNGESGWKVYATNSSSGAYGIPQSLPADKMAADGSDWQTDATTQIKWGLSYISGRYGSPCTAYDDWLARSPHWY
jgi:peptidoglycan hydrolase-like protein with peptidoglycan-binding domain